MCGIVGIWNQGGRPVDLGALQRATARLRHRGPDDEGYLLVDREKDRVISCRGRDSDPNLDLPQIEDFLGERFDLAFGFRRLAILDLSPTGHQPMSNEDGTLWLVLNGEIYNYLDLRQRLEARGHRFASRTDTEVLLHGYEEYGEMILEHLNGMFAFALWDGRARRLFCARDRLGIKPFYYHLDPEALLFSSEIKALLEARPQLKSANLPYLKDFIAKGLLDHSSQTLFEGILQLPPAHFFLLAPDSFRLQRYWNFNQKRAADRYDYLHPKETLRFLLHDAVRLQLQSDVPVGTCLSGGLDSTSIVALASRLLMHPMKSFSSLYQERGYEEREFVKIAAAAFRTESHVVEPNPHGFLPILERIVWHLDEPTGAPGIYSQWSVMQEAQGQVKVLLDGQGGDELLGGYHDYFFPYLHFLWDGFRKSKNPRHLMRMGREAFQIWSLVWENFRFMGPRPFTGKLLTKIRARRQGYGGSSVLCAEFEKGVPWPERETQDCPAGLADPLSRRLYWDLVRDSVPALLHYEDRNSMAFGIEARVPLLDHRIVEFCLGLSPEFKIRGDRTKLLLREGMADLLPKEIANRRDKKGYPTPLAAWLRDGLYPQVREFLLSFTPEEPAILDRNKMDKLLKEHHRGRQDLSSEILRWLTCKLWFRVFGP
ncbi:MAG: asparagine synthase (glutamine-hydrolyzing) [candidate division NC10 bacterium]|nr:asparagine synthase (glutamine-hydrolyzing) [candidate division NC10 bacterium]